jgi:class 3 adenylate cyclase
LRRAKDLHKRSRGPYRRGIVTLLFTDLVESSELVEKLGEDRANRIRRSYFRLVRMAARRYGGQEVKNLGDGLMVVFGSAVDAVSSGILIQQTVHQQNLDAPDFPLGVRVGLHAGEPIRERDDYFGQPVVIAKRLCDSAQGGQIIVSDLVRSIVGSREEFDFSEVGFLALKGIAGPVLALEVGWSPTSDLPERSPESQADDADDGLAPAQAARKRGGSRAFRMTGIAVALIVAALVGAIIAARLSERDVPAPASKDNENPTPPVDEPELDLSLAESKLSWRRVDSSREKSFADPGNQTITRLTSEGNTLVAVGIEEHDSGFGGAVWTSKNGIRWDRQRTGLDQSGSQQMYGVDFGGPGVVAVGSSTAGGGDAAVWTSRNTRSWNFVSDSALGGAGFQEMRRVIATDSGLVAIGSETVSGDQNGAVWTSKNGSSWSRITDQDAALGGAGDQTMISLTEAGSMLVVVGFDTSTDTSGGIDAAVWISRDDGRTWRRIRERILGGQGDQELTSVAYGADDLIVGVGWHNLTQRSDQDASVWTSRNGTDWARAPFVETTFGGEGDQVILGVESFSEGFVAVGRNTAGGGADAAVWTSENGQEWSKRSLREGIFGGDGYQGIRWVTVFNDRIIAAGTSGRQRNLDAAVWHAKLP